MFNSSIEPPYYAVIFTSKRTDGDHGYNSMSTKMAELAQKQHGFLGVDSAREDVGITVSYWASLDDIKNWQANSSHLIAQKQGRNMWYESFTTRICKVEREYSFEA